MARLATGGNKLKKFLRNHKRQLEEYEATVGYHTRDGAIRAARQEWGAQRSDGQRTPATGFMTRGVRRVSGDVKRELRRGAADPRKAKQALQAAGKAMEKSIDQSREDAGHKRSGLLEDRLETRVVRRNVP